MNTKITNRNTLIPAATTTSENVSTSEGASKAAANQGITKSTDAFETPKQFDSIGSERAKTQETGAGGHSVSDLRMMASAAKASGKPPFSEANLNRLLAKNKNNYQEVTADLKTWVNKNLHLTPTQKAPFDRMPQDDLGHIQRSASKATDLGKIVEVKIQDTAANDPNLDKELRYKETEVADRVTINLQKRPHVKHQAPEELNLQTKNQKNLESL